MADILVRAGKTAGGCGEGTLVTLCFVIMSIIKHCQRIKYQRMKRSWNKKEEDRQREDGPFLKPSDRHEQHSLRAQR